jgi:hypothetical protein
MKYTYISSNDELSAYLNKFEDRKDYIIALDIEAELNRHAYGETLTCPPGTIPVIIS